MKSRQKYILLLSVIVITVFFAIICCKSVQPNENPEIADSPEDTQPVLPSDFTGTWERANSKNTLTFTSTTIKASNQNYTWVLSSVSGDIYTIYPEPKPELKGTIKVNRTGDTLDIVDAYDMPNAGVWSGGEDDWTGKWKMK